MGVTRDSEYVKPVGYFTDNGTRDGRATEPGVYWCDGLSNVSTPSGAFWHVVGHDGSEQCLYRSHEEALYALNETRVDPPPSIYIPLQITPSIYVKVEATLPGTMEPVEIEQTLSLRDEQFEALVDPDPPKVLLEYDNNGELVSHGEIVDAIFDED